MWTTTKQQRFALATAAHHFLLSALPVRHPESLDALQTFLSAVGSIRLAWAESEPVLTRILVVIEQVNEPPGRFSHDFVSSPDTPFNASVRFSACAQDALKYASRRSLLVEQAVRLILTQSGSSTLFPRHVCQQLRVSQETLCRRFKLATGSTIRAFIRDARLDGAATLLLDTVLSVKEVWARAGYNDGCNFAHEFKSRFGVTPTDYRGGLAPTPQHANTTKPKDRIQATGQCPRSTITSQRRILLVEDDPISRQIISQYLTIEGHAVSCAGSGNEGLSIADRVSPDVILLDYHLPDMTGLDWLRARAARSGNAQTFVFTADWSVEDYATEIGYFGASIVSKLCDLESIGRLVVSGSSQVRVQHQTTSPLLAGSASR